jgi:hypothetical protein
MKKMILIGFSLVALLILNATSFANPAATAFFTSAKHPAPKISGMQSGAYPLTDITIFNDSYDDIAVTANNPYGYYNNSVYAQDYLHFLDYNWSGLTEIILADYYGYVFFDRYVDNHATIAVSDPYGVAGDHGKSHQYRVEVR